MHTGVTPPQITVCVSTRNRAAMLDDLFAALAAQDIDATFELSLTDNHSSDDTLEVARRLAATAPFAVRTQRNERDEGPAAGRNLAAANATAPILAFTDDDCRPTPGWLRAGFAAMQAGHAVVVGAVVAPAEAGPPHPLGRVVTSNHWRFFTTSNVFYRAEEFANAGGFDVGFVGVGGEDADLGLRVCKAGAEPRYEPTAVVVHPVRSPSLAVTLREATRWHSVPRLIRKHPEQRRWLLHNRVFWRPSHQWILVALAAGTLGVTRHRVFFLGVVPWFWNRVMRARTRKARRTNLRYAPVLAAVDVLEVLAMIRGSLRERSLTL